MRKNFGTLLIGVVFLIFGGGYVVARLLGYDPPFFFDGWWTLFLMIPAVISMVETGVHVGNSIILVVGLLLLAGAQRWIENLNFTLVLAVVLVLLGVYFVVRAVAGVRGKTVSSGTRPQWSGGKVDGGESPSYTALFTGSQVKNTAQNLMGGTCTAVFGRLQADLSDAVVNHDVTVFCNAVMGQAVIYAPRNVRIVCKNVPILGGVQLRAESLPPEASAPTVTFDCTCVLGGVDIL